jgi:hypothetical protein
LHHASICETWSYNNCRPSQAAPAWAEYSSTTGSQLQKQHQPVLLLIFVIAIYIIALLYHLESPFRQHTRLDSFFVPAIPEEFPRNIHKNGRHQD